MTNDLGPLYLVVWYAGLYTPAHAFVSAKAFTNDEGFDDEDIAAIASLQIAQMWTGDDITVLRVDNDLVPVQGRPIK